MSRFAKTRRRSRTSPRFLNISTYSHEQSIHRLLTSVLLDKLVLVLVEVALPLGEIFVDQSVRAVLVTHVQLGLLRYLLGEWARVDPVVLVSLLLLLEEGEGLGCPVGVPLLGGVALPSLLDPTPLP